jgi:hypothetical protein
MKQMSWAIVVIGLLLAGSTLAAEAAGGGGGYHGGGGGYHGGGGGYHGGGGGYHGGGGGYHGGGYGAPGRYLGGGVGGGGGGGTRLVGRALPLLFRAARGGPVGAHGVHPAGARGPAAGLLVLLPEREGVLPVRQGMPRRMDAGGAATRPTWPLDVGRPEELARAVNGGLRWPPVPLLHRLTPARERNDPRWLSHPIARGVGTAPDPPRLQRIERIASRRPDSYWGVESR